MYAIFKFHLFEADDPRVEATMKAIEEKLWVKTRVGGVARYENDYYHRISNDIAAVPGNPWFICTLWLADYFITRAKTTAELKLALPIFESLGDLKGQAIALNNLGIEAYYDGKWALALEVYERSRGLFERIGDVDNVAMAVNNIGEILSDQGKLDEAETLFRQVQATVDAAGHRGLSMMSRLNLGRAAARAGRFTEADELLTEAIEGFREMGAASFEQEVHARIAEAAVLAGDHARALHEVELAELSGEAEPPPALRAALDRVRGYAYLQLHDRDAAASEFGKSVEVARESATLYELALSLRAQETLGGGSGEDGEAQRLLDALEVVSLPGVPTV